MFYDPSLKPTISPVVELEPWRQWLLTAAEMIARYGHCKHAMYHEDGRMCLYGALQKAQPLFSNASIYRITDALSKVTHVTSAHDLIAWNDRPERTKEEVINALREAASI
jgi:hypothetical protein